MIDWTKRDKYLFFKEIICNFVVMKEIIYREVEELVLLEDNPRKISDEHDT